MRETDQDLLGGGEGGLLGSQDLNHVLLCGVLDIFDVVDVPGRGVVVPSRDRDLDAVLLLQLLERRGTLADDGRVLRVRNDDTVNDAGLEGGDFAREGGADLFCDRLGASDRDEVGRVALLGEANSVARRARFRRSTTAGDELSD